MTKKRFNDYKYDAKTEKKFCESIPEKVKWDFQLKSFTWTYKEVHLLEETEVGKSYEKKYTPDLFFPEAGMIFELKGFLRPDAKKRMEIFAKLYPDVDVRVVFNKDKPIRKGAKLTYTGWAEKNGFQSCVAMTYQELPLSWRKELEEAGKKVKNVRKKS